MVIYGLRRIVGSLIDVKACFYDYIYDRNDIRLLENVEKVRQGDAAKP